MPKKIMSIVLAMLLALSLISGCAGRQQADDEPTEFMAWQFARAVVRQYITRPSRSIFPRYSQKFIEKPERNVFVVTAYVHTQDENDATVVYDFTVTVRYIGNEIFEEVSAEVTRSY